MKRIQEKNLTDEMEFGQEPERRIWKETAKCKGKETAGTKVLQPTRALSILSTERSSM